ncbi:MAG: hypothetical protein WCP28_03960 [Actinomycetes bacterium]
MSTALDEGRARVRWRAESINNHTVQVLLGAAIGLLVGVAVVMPWVRSGYLILLDWISGPNQTTTGRLYGISGEQIDGLPWRIGVQALRDVIGSAATAWVLILVFFPLAAAGMAHLVRGTTSQTVVATLAITCNPIVVTRIAAGHVPYLIGVACLPWLLAAALNAKRSDRWFSARTAGWYAVGMAITPHMAWLGGATLLIVALLPYPSKRSIVRLVLTVIAAATVYSYGLVVWLVGVRVPNVNSAALAEYATRPDDSGLLITVLSLRGFWRERTIGVGSSLQMWWIPIVIVLLVLVFIGFGGYAKDRAVRGPVFFGMMVFGVIASCGASGPFGFLYELAFSHLPLFEAMREPLKWLPLVLIPMAAGLARATPTIANWFTNTVARPVGSTAMVLAMVICAAPAIACAPALIWGLGGRLQTSEYPDGWYAAQAAAGDGQGSILFLPWHEYQAFDFTDGRAVATPARAFFSRPAITSDAVELGKLRSDSTSSRSAFLDQVLAIGRKQNNLGVLLAPLGVEYVAVATDTSVPETFGWLEQQGSLTRVLQTPSMRLYRVDRAATGRVVGSRQASLKELLDLANKGELGTEATLPLGPTEPPVPSTQSGRLTRTSPTEWEVSAGEPGWVVVPEDWSAGWRIIPAGGGAEVPGVQTTQGLVAFKLDAGEATITYRPWDYIGPAVLVSALALLTLVIIGLLENRAVLLRSRLGRVVPTEVRD